MTRFNRASTFRAMTRLFLGGLLAMFGLVAVVPSQAGAKLGLMSGRPTVTNGGNCQFSGLGVVNGGGPPGSSAYILGTSAPDLRGTDGTVIKGSATLTDPNAFFSSADIGYGIVLAASTSPLAIQSTVVLSVESPTQITMATASSVSLEGDAIYTIGIGVGTTCTGLSGLSISSPLIESLEDPQSLVVTGTDPGGDKGNEAWLGWSGENGYYSTGSPTYTAPGPVGYVLPYSGSGTSGGCPLASALCGTKNKQSGLKWYGSDPQATCPPNLAEEDAGFVNCSLTTFVPTSTSAFVPTKLLIGYADTPTPDKPDATLNPNPSNGVRPNETFVVNSCNSCNWWGAGPEGSPGIVDPSGNNEVATAVPAPTIWIGSTRDTAVRSTDSSVTITPSTYDCGSSGGSSGKPPYPLANCALGQGTISGSFVTPSALPCTACNIYIDEPNLTLTQGEYSGTAAYNGGLDYNLVNAVEEVVVGGVVPPPRSYVALGDSYSAGEGNPPFLPGTDVKGQNTCHRSKVAYPWLLAQTVTSLQLSFVACSGATTGNVWSGGNPPESTTKDPEPLQIDLLSSSTKLVTITIGGNDIDFADVLSDCVIWTCAVAETHSSLLNNLSASISALQPTLTSTYTAIKAAAPNAKVIVIGYPDVLPPHPSIAQNAGSCLAQSGLIGGSLGWLAPKQAQLNAVVQAAAQAAGVEYVNPNLPGAPYSFLGHDVCSSDSWFISVLNRSPTHYSFHPTATGQAELEAALVASGATG